MQSTGIEARLERVSSLGAADAVAAPAVPRSARVELTSACNLRCFFCAHEKHPRKPSEMPRELFTRLARELREAGVEELGLFYIGEPMLCEWLPDAIEHAKSELGFPYVFLTTNGIAATPRRVHACMKAGLDSLKFALNFSGRTQWRVLAGGTPDTLEAVVQNVKSARWVRDRLERLTGRRCGLYASSLRYDDEQPERMRTLLEGITPYVDVHYWLPLIGHCGLPLAAAGAPGRYAADPARKALPCWSLFTAAYVTSDAKLSACPLDASPRFHMGDLARTSFREAWDGARFQRLRAAHLAADVRGTACEHCIAYPGSWPPSPSASTTSPASRSRT